MSEVAKKLRDRRLNVWEQAKGLADEASEQNRAFTAEEQGTWDALNGELDELDKRIKSCLDAEQRAKDADKAFDSLTGREVDQRRRAQRGDTTAVPGSADDLDGELRAFLGGAPGAPRSFEVRHDPARGPISYRTLSTLTTGAGGNLIPTDFYDRLISHLIEVSGVMQAGPTILNTAGGETLQIPKTTAHSTGTSATQAQTLPTSDPTFALATLSAYKYGILLQVARELIDDQGVDLIGYLGMQAGRAIGNKFGSDLVSGTGTAQPKGFMSSATVGVTGTTTGKSGAPQYADLVNLEYSVIAPYRQSRSCYWIARDATIGGFRLLLDSQNRPIWEPSMVLGSPDLLLGKPLVADPFMPASATAANSVAFGDFSQFFVRLVGGVRFERSDDFAFGSDLISFRCVLRGDGALVDTSGAIKMYQAPAT
jgi:HK97 family phage major capsid protein